MKIKKDQLKKKFLKKHKWIELYWVFQERAMARAYESISRIEKDMQREAKLKGITDIKFAGTQEGIFGIDIGDVMTKGEDWSKNRGILHDSDLSDVKWE